MSEIMPIFTYNLKQLIMKNQKTVTDRDSAAIDLYFRDIRGFEMLTADEEIELAKQVRQGDPKATERLITSNLRFVISVAKKYQSKGTPLSDLISEGNLGLIEAAKRFDPDRGFRFITYANWWIRQAILGTIDNGIKNSHTSLNQERGEEGDGFTLAETISSDAPEADHITMQTSLTKDVERLLSTLSSRDAEILKLLFAIGGGEPMHPEDAGKRFGLTPQRVGQIRDAALKTLAVKREFIQEYL
jgi:RNA polymerase primary sigma factor